MYHPIDPAALRAMLDTGDPPVVLDVRSADEVARGYLEGARHIPLGELPARLGELAADAPLVIYCHSGVRSANACRFLAERGYTNLYHLEGGILAWAHANQPIRR
jgi:rhodanese-related sulfurtransferase